MHATNVEQPWEIVCVDLSGPLPRSTAGNTWLLVMQDRFTKWVEVRQLRKTTSHAVVTAMEDQIFLRHGCPNTIRSNNGRQFIGKEVDLTTQGHAH